MNGRNSKKRALYDGDFRATGDNDLDILERMLDGLGVGKPRDVAVRLLERFGGFSGVFAATEAELEDMGLSARESAFFAFVNPALKRGIADGESASIADERAAVNCALALFGRNSKTGLYAVYLDGVGHKICSEYLGETAPFGAAAVGACRYKTKKLLIVSVKRDGDVGELELSRAAELSDTTRLLDILEIELVDFLETDGAEFFSVRRAIERGTGKASVPDAGDAPFEETDFRSGIERYVSAARAAKSRR
ncbi:MAG: hypothetical protein J1G04_04890 [Clostridiales bacterium]|nr:hypothetical protein [Clostridiales bacterium]